MRIVAMALGVLGLVGIAFSAISIAGLPLSDTGDVFKTVAILVVCAGAFFSLWSALRERWPALRERTVLGQPYISVAAFIVFFVSLIGLAGITIIVDQVVRQPTAGIAFRLGLLFFVSVAMLFGAWAFHRRRRT